MVQWHIVICNIVTLHERCELISHICKEKYFES